MPKKKAKKKEIPTSAEFDLDKFVSTQFKERTSELPVDDLAEFYPPGVKPVMVVKGLTALELAQVDEEVRVNNDARNESTVKALKTEAIEALRTLLRTHMQDATPDAYVKTLSMVHLGLVKPKMEYDQVVKFATAFPIEFRLAYLEINRLTGRGMDFEKKHKGSGQTQES